MVLSRRRWVRSVVSVWGRRTACRGGQLVEARRGVHKPNNDTYDSSSPLRAATARAHPPSSPSQVYLPQPPELARALHNLRPTVSLAMVATPPPPLHQAPVPPRHFLAVVSFVSTSAAAVWKEVSIDGATVHCD
eukprot:Sspe_Gene.43041::Locus_20924_Transcript_2_3_Confidence_0.714_Length_534::g.43041::m.43041